MSKNKAEKPECGFNEYEDTARAQATTPTGWSWVYIGPVAGAPKAPIVAPAPKPLTQAELKKLRADAEKNARAEAQDDIAFISASKCPSRCNQKVDLDSNFFDKPYLVGQPRHRIEASPDIKYSIGRPPNPTQMVIRIRWQVWVQEAEQKYHVHFSCAG